MSVFHYKAYKLREDEDTVVYNLNTEFIMTPDEYAKVIIRKQDRAVLNWEEIKDLEHFSGYYKPLNWLRARCLDEEGHAKEELQLIA